MKPNPALKKLGLADNDRAVIIHVDDVGMCEATLSAYDDLMDFGLISSAAVMVPCPWFPQTAAYCRKHPEVDMGVHLTLTSEWDGYRWAPISTADLASGLIDDEGYFYRRQPPVQERGTPEAARTEMKAQIDRALAAGIDATHTDSHMGTIAHEKFLPAYVELATAYKLPPTILFRGDKVGFRARGLGDELATMAADASEKAELGGIPLLDHEFGLPLDRPQERLGQAKQAFSNLQPGITHFYIHAAKDTPELRAIAPDWESRVADYETFLSSELRDFIRNQGIHVIGNRVLRDLMRA
ncbi:MAG: polysaccharide deacetylase family protein [Chloroflexi bacterium]|nr:polysaccharide deacetylase family protein [Chloroflexota bacterium]MCC6894087.1 polysaccharide deacetylase family protein [Anaerolineae bacterium]